MSKIGYGTSAQGSGISGELLEAIRLFNSFSTGTQWINERKARGIDVTDDIRSFNKNIVSKMDKAYLSMTELDRKFFNKCRETAKMFNGTIEINAYYKLNTKASRRAHGTDRRSTGGI